MCERGTERDTLLLTARQLTRPGRGAVSQPDPLEQLVGPQPALARSRTEQTELQPDQIAGPELGRERAGIVLIDVPQLVGAERSHSPP